MSVEVERRLVEHLVLLNHDVLLLVEGTDDVGAAHALVEVRVDGAPQCSANFAELVVSCDPGLANFVHEVSHENKANDNFPASDVDHHGDNNDDVRHHVCHSIEWVDHLAVENSQVTVEYLKNFTDRSDIEE